MRKLVPLLCSRRSAGDSSQNEGGSTATSKNELHTRTRFVLPFAANAFLTTYVHESDENSLTALCAAYDDTRAGMPHTRPAVISDANYADAVAVGGSRFR